MAQDMIGYDALAREALRTVVREALRRVADEGLPGAHHFYISFKTKAPGVDLDPKLLERFPDEMTIVLEHQFWDLAVDEDAFEVTLQFNQAPKYLRVPFDALTQFSDPGVSFGLRFDATPHSDNDTSGTDQNGTNADEAAPKRAKKRTSNTKNPAAVEPSASDTPPDDATDAATDKVVSLDAFRKKPGTD